MQGKSAKGTAPLLSSVGKLIAEVAVHANEAAIGKKSSKGLLVDLKNAEMGPVGLMGE